MPVTLTTTIVLTGVLLLLAAAHIGVPMVVRWIQQVRLARRCAARGMLVLTYDDGPSPSLTSRLLELLDSCGARVTFFVTGARARAHPDLVDRLVREGHEIGTHTDRHHHAWRTWPWTTVRDMRAGYDALAPWVGPDAVFRPPYGKLTLPTLLGALRRRAPLGWWTIDAGDTRPDLPDPQDLLGSIRRRGGGIVLLHDFHRDPQRALHVLSLTMSLLDLARDEGWTVHTIGEVLGREAPSRPSSASPAPSQGRRRAA